jgi:hypothetical protein
VMVALVPEPELLPFKLDPGQLALLPPPGGRRRWRHRIGVRQVGEQSGQVSHRLRPHGPVKPVTELGFVEPSVTEVLSQAIGDRSPFGVPDSHVRAGPASPPQGRSGWLRRAHGSGHSVQGPLGQLRHACMLLENSVAMD